MVEAQVAEAARIAAIALEAERKAAAERAEK